MSKGKRGFHLPLWVFLTMLCTLPSSWAQSVPGQKQIAPHAAGTFGKDAAIQDTEGKALVDPNFGKCGQDCLFETANQNITVQVHYIKRKVAFLENDNATDEQKREVLGAFCPAAEDVDDCVERYKEVNEFWMMKARTALSKNNNAIVRLRCTKHDPQGNCISGFDGTTVEQGVIDPNAGPYQNKVLFVPQSSALGTYMQTQNPKNKIQHSNDALLMQMRNEFEPKAEDFVKFKKIPRDPSNPGEFLEVPDGYDTVAFNKAHNEWLKLHQNLKELNQGRTMKDDIARDRQKVMQEFTSPARGDARSTRRQLYDAARGELIQYIDHQVKQGFTPNQSRTPRPGPTSGPTAGQGTTQTTTQTAGKVANPTATFTPTSPAGGYTGEEQPLPSVGTKTQQGTYDIHYNPSGIDTKFDTPISQPTDGAQISGTQTSHTPQTSTTPSNTNTPTNPYQGNTTGTPSTPSNYPPNNTNSNHPLTSPAQRHPGSVSEPPTNSKGWGNTGTPTNRTPSTTDTQGLIESFPGINP